MKKIMFGLAAAIAMVAAADIESSNVVGYMQNPVSGFKMVTPTFKNITSVDFPIDNLMINGATDGMTNIQILDADGQVIGDYYWYNEFNGLPAGWFDVTGVEPAGISLKPGEAVLLYTSEEGITVTTAGEVPAEITHDVTGFAMLGNGSPVAIDADAMSVTGATDGMTNIQVLDENGQVVGDYYWYNEFNGLPAGWFDVTGVEPAGVTLNPGDAVLFYSSEDGVSMSIPAATK